MPALDDPLQFLPGIGPARAAALAGVGWCSAWDVLHCCPRLAEPPPPLSETGALAPGTAVRLRARLVAARPRFARGRGMALDATLARADGLALRARFFNAGWVRRLLVPGEWFLWEGRTDAADPGLLLHPSFTHLSDPAVPPPVETGWRTVYRLPEGVGERTVRTLVDGLLATHLGLCRDPLPAESGGLADDAWQAALRDLHQPPDPLAHERARRLLAARELLALAWALHERRRLAVAGAGHPVPWDDALHQRALARLPFTLTAGQQEALAGIRADMQAPAPMLRLLHGDVGSGKTALALLAALAVVGDGGQAALLAPTAVLAGQHTRFVQGCLAGTRVVVGLLTGGTPPAERAALLAAVAAGTCHLLIGTHALLGDGLRFAALRLVVIDEQHKFGVHQRAALIERGGQNQPRPHLLLLTATPIPRTLALTVFGDLALSRIAGRPPGRAAVATEVQAGGLATVRQALVALGRDGGLALIVCPLREESEEVDAHDAEGVAAALGRGEAGGVVDLLTGAMAEERKLAVMERFRAGTCRVLVSTTVVEVGIDVPDLALVAVLDADRFGLAQLHQLRGRLGRGTRPGRCLLLHRDTADTARLAALAASDDGLAIAEADLAARGPGELLGSRQHGLPRLRIADLARDLDLLQEAHQRVRGMGGPPPAALAPWLPGDGMAAPEG